MMKVRGVESLALVAGMVAAEAMGSGVGVSYYQPSTPVPSGPAAACAPVASCSNCKRLGFACVDHASPAPCTPEGGCQPNGPFGFAQPHWRRWPGTEVGGPAPEVAPEPGSLIPRYDEPAPEDEDQQAPPSLDESSAAAEAEAEGESEGPAMNRPGREISLPPMPRPSLPSARPGANPPPANNNNDAAPPSLPFGYTPPASGVDAYGPPAPAFNSTTPTSLPKPEAGKRDLPPPLPVGFTQNSVSPTPRRLPTTFGRPGMETPHFDTAIQPASANLPVQR